VKLQLDHTNPDRKFGACDRCGAEVERYRGENDIQCPECKANYNCFGQRLRDDLHERPAVYDDDDIANSVLFAMEDEIKSVFDHPEGDGEVGL